jgi:CRP/FNR family transcriptional regulator, anaerobic regulatory protein
MCMEQLLTLLAAISPLDAELHDLLSDNLERITCEVGDCLLKDGEVSRYISYIESGLVRSCHLLDGVDVTTWFNKETDFFYNVNSFSPQNPSRQMIFALEPCVIWRISYDKFMFMCDTYPVFHKFRANIIEKYYGLVLELINVMRMNNPGEIYAYLMENKPDLLQRVPVKYLGSFMNVSERTYVRLRNNYKKPKK